MGEPTLRRGETRQKILDAAGRLFRAQGVDGTGIDAVMREAGLTHGGFYLHFASKEALAAAVSQSLLEQAARTWDAASHSADPDAALQQIVGNYLDPERVALGKCCMLTTLGPDVARRPASREAIGAALRSMLDTLQRCLPGATPGHAAAPDTASSHAPAPATTAVVSQEQAMTTLSTMVGAVVLARIADDPALAQAFLAAASAAILPQPSEGAITHRASTGRHPAA